MTNETEDKKQQRAREGAQAWADYEAERRALRERTERLRALRLARDAATDQLAGRALNEEGRKRVVEMMWEIAYADGHITEFESNLIWRAADLLGVSSRERIELGRRVASERGSETP